MGPFPRDTARAAAGLSPRDDGADERRILAWMCVLIAVNQLGFGAVVPVLPLYAQSFDVSQSAIGATVAVYGLGRFLVAMPTGRMADWLGRRPTLAIGGAVSALGNLGCALAGSYSELVAARLVAGFGAGLVVTCGAVVLADISTPQRRGRTMAIYQGVFLFAVGIGPFPGGLIAEHFGLAAPFAAYAFAAMAVGILAWFAIAETRGLRAEASGTDAFRIAYIEQLKTVFRDVGFCLVGGIMLMNTIARTGALFSIVPVLAVERLAISASRIGLGLALGSVAGILITYPAGMLVDRYGRKAVIVPATIATAASLALFVLSPNYQGFLLACLVWGIASAVGGAAPAAYVADTAPAGMNATAMSTYRMIGDFGYFIGPIALGALADWQGKASALWLAGAGLLAFGIAFWRFAPETYRAR